MENIITDSYASYQRYLKDQNSWDVIWSNMEKETTPIKEDEEIEEELLWS